MDLDIRPPHFDIIHTLQDGLGVLFLARVFFPRFIQRVLLTVLFAALTEAGKVYADRYILRRHKR